MWQVHNQPIQECFAAYTKPCCIGAPILPQCSASSFKDATFSSFVSCLSHMCTDPTPHPTHILTCMQCMHTYHSHTHTHTLAHAHTRTIVNRHAHIPLTSDISNYHAHETHTCKHTHTHTPPHTHTHMHASIHICARTHLMMQRQVWAPVPWRQ